MESDNIRPVVAVGELLWDVLPSGPVLGGAPGNFAVRLASLGVPAFLVSKLGRDALGAEALKILGSLGVNTDYVQVEEGRRTGTVDVTLSASGNASYVINRDVAYDFIEVPEKLKQLLTVASVVCFGTLVQRAPAARASVEEILRLATGAIKLLDINLRKDCYTPETIRSSLDAADILKLNQDEIGELAPILELKGKSIEDRAIELVSRYTLQSCLVTRAEDGVMAASSAGDIVSLPGHKVAVADTIGSGDAFTAGFVSQLLRGRSLAQCCRYGNALGAVVATKKGGMSVVDADELARISFENSGANVASTQ